MALGWSQLAIDANNKRLNKTTSRTMANTINKETKNADVAEEKAAILSTRVIKNNDGEQVGTILEAGFQSVKVEILDNLFDSCKLEDAAKSVLLFWYYGDSEHLVKSWMLGAIDANEGTEDQVESLTAPTFQPALYKKQFGFIDLEHRKVTPDKDGKVSEYKDTGRKKWDAEKKEEVPVFAWTADGDPLFSSKQRKLVNNFVHRAISSLDLEPEYADGIKKAIGGGFRTISQSRNDARGVLVHKMVQPDKIKGKKKTHSVAGRELSTEQLIEAAAETIKQNPDAFLDQEQQDNE